MMTLHEVAAYVATTLLVLVRDRNDAVGRALRDRHAWLEQEILGVIDRAVDGGAAFASGAAERENAAAHAVLDAAGIGPGSTVWRVQLLANELCEAIAACNRLQRERDAITRELHAELDRVVVPTHASAVARVRALAKQRDDASGITTTAVVGAWHDVLDEVNAPPGASATERVRAIARQRDVARVDAGMFSERMDHARRVLDGAS